MSSRPKTKIIYVTSNQFKIAENKVVVENCRLSDGTLVEELFEFDFREVPIKEVLEVDLSTMVMAEVTKAYSDIKVPCIVEHAGLIFEGHDTYPGGLTKPMWNALGDRFIAETHSAGRGATARAVVAYCDGRGVQTFDGETPGTIAVAPRGSNQFYWDTIFIPSEATGAAINKTYAEIADDPSLGIKYKMTVLSQSARAMLKFLEYRRSTPPDLWPRHP